MNDNPKISPQEISNEMVCSIASMAAIGVEGVDKMFMRLSDEILDVLNPSAVAKGVKVVKLEEGYHIDVHVITELGIMIPEVARKVQIKVKESVEIMTGNQVAQVNVHVKGSGKY